MIRSLIRSLFQRRFTIVEVGLLVLILILAGLVFVRSCESRQAAQMETHRVLIYTAHHGDTLWDVTERAVSCEALLCPSGDLREALSAVDALNPRYRVEPIHPGDRIAIPITNPAAPPEPAIQTALEAIHWGEVHLDPSLFPSTKI